jgi:KaiC/GvpD/RAD55 family RecA-like ATPase
MAKQSINKNLAEALHEYKSGAIFMMELTAERYLEENLASVKLLLTKSFEGVYISFHRPFNNLSLVMEKSGINVNKLMIVDVATAVTQETQAVHTRCVHISPAIDIDELVRAIYTSMLKLKSKKQFVFIDSLSTITLYKPLSETMRFSEFLIRTVKSHSVDTTLIFNVAQDFSQKKFIKDIAIHVDKIIQAG